MNEISLMNISLILRVPAAMVWNKANVTFTKGDGSLLQKGVLESLRNPKW